MDTQREIEHLENRNKVLQVYLNAYLANEFTNYLNIAAFSEAFSRNKARIRKLQKK